MTTTFWPTFSGVQKLSPAQMTLSPSTPGMRGMRGVAPMAQITSSKPMAVSSSGVTAWPSLTVMAGLALTWSMR